METANRAVTSREYKLMLNVDRFADRERGTRQLWAMVEFLVDKAGGVVSEQQDEEETRETFYLDTPGHDLRQRGLALRVRREKEEKKGKKEKEKKKRKVTLKLRETDRYLAAAFDLRTTAKDPEWKFEEDILPPFAGAFAHSVSFETKTDPEVDSVADLVTLFPGLRGLSLPAGTSVGTVNGFTAREIARKLGKVRFGDETLVKAMASFWYLAGAPGDYPLVAEFSFDYDAPGSTDALEQFPPRVVRGSNDLFASLQRQSGWLDLTGTTKTAAAYASF
jgi:CYTH domain